MRFWVFGCLLFASVAQGQFSEVSGSDPLSGGPFTDANVAVEGAKAGGIAFADFTGDGCLDILINTNAATQRSRILISDCAANPQFRDETTTRAVGLLDGSPAPASHFERSVVVGDLNADGALDFVRNTFTAIEVYLNNGATFGIAGQPNQTFTRAGGFTNYPVFNTEGLSLLDAEGDGDLDLVIENHDDGLVLLLNNGTGTLAEQDPADNGLPTSTGGNGDYMATGDFDLDGDVDIVARKPNTHADIYVNNSETTAGTFSAVPTATFDQPSSNGNKGGVILCDFDADGDLDLYWADNGTSQIWTNTGIGWTATGEPSGVNANRTGAACGDVDSDGDMDLFLAGLGDDQLFLNDGDGTFTENNLGITTSANSFGTVFGDYDNDGDLDLLINVSGGVELWRNGSTATSYVNVRPQTAVGAPATGATVQIFAADGTTRAAPTIQISGGDGNGSGGDGGGETHHGLAEGEAGFYEILVTFPTGETVRRCVQPSSLTDQTLSVTPASGDTTCEDADGDDVPDIFDVDSDGDGILDSVETSGFASDPDADDDGDGIPNYQDTDLVTCPDAGGDGVCDSLPAAIDADGDGFPNHLDLDADGDGLTDTLETGGTDADGDGAPDACTSVTTTGACTAGGLSGAPPNLDGGAPNYLDLDSDGDGLGDAIEAYDTDGNGMINGAETAPAGSDSDSDGIDDAFDPDEAGSDPTTTPFGAVEDSDGNGTPDWLQTCGDGYVRGEACDDGNTTAGDGCSATCMLEVGVEITAPTGTVPSTSVTPSGTSVAPNGTTVSVTITGEGGPFTCMAMVMSNMWSCPAAISGLSAGEDYSVSASVTVGGMTATDMETFSIPPCVDSTEGDACTDNRGASSETGVCSADGAAGVCVSCVDDSTGSGTDSGCMDSAPVCDGTGAGATCVACLDDTAGMTDVGCDLAGAAGPVCDTSGGTNVCVPCEDNGSGTDNGCTAAAPLCIPGAGGAPTCVECAMSDDCGAGEVCGSANTCVPGCDEDADCAGTPATPVCNVPTNTCVECTSDAMCSGIETCSSMNTCELPDSDMDGVFDDVDLDDDNDGILDEDELTGDLTMDSDDDGVPDYLEPALVTCEDTAPMDGICDAVPADLDFDGDGIANHLDLDADGDGIADAIEGGGTDADGDGVVDMFEDMDGNGVDDDVDAMPLPIPNTDGSEGPDFLDLDADGDGLTDALEAGGTDANGDGVPDGALTDGNGDGLADELDLGDALPIPDTDGDGTPDYQDIDSDGDGIDDAIEAHDADGDGEADVVPVNMDADEDGIDDAFDPDCAAAGDCGGTLGTIATEPNRDTDLLPDWRDVDADGDGIPDAVECPMPAMCADSDMDDVPDYLETDADSDGIDDAIEGHDPGSDGVADITPSGADSDGDGLDDAFDADCMLAADCAGVIGVPAPLPDLDEDDLPNFQDRDDDNDSILTATEIQDADDYVGPATDPGDVDEDGLPNWYDTDSDGDEVSDMTEDTRPDEDGDLDDNDILDYLDPGFAPQDTDGDGILDVIECPGIVPPTDECPDSDGDGAPDFNDVDDDNDGILTADEFGAPDPDGDHDADNDGVQNHLDLDADNDGIPDLLENGGAGLDADGDGVVDAPVDADGDGLLAAFDMDDADADNVMTEAPTNTDGSGPADYLDLDADDDGLLDIVEADGADDDGDGVVDSVTDTDGDGLADVVDPSDGGTPWAVPDTDDDGEFDFQDVDSDGDSVPDATEAYDADADGRPDVTPSGMDMNQDGVDDAFAMTPPTQPNTDGDDQPNWRDRDDDGDGIPTALEDVDGNGSVENDDTDGDGRPNYLDDDDDGDLVPTASEAPDPNGDEDPADARDTDEDGTPDYLDNDDDGDSVLTRFENPDPNEDRDPEDAQDTDGDGTPDYLDDDDDDDGLLTRDESPDPNGDGDPSDATDDDGDGTPNYLQPGGSFDNGGFSGGALCAASGGESVPFAAMVLIGLIARRRR
ncbi:MAG: FG-GAP-like repeat-containing protein [Myxococcota bacterium]